MCLSDAIYSELLRGHLKLLLDVQLLKFSLVVAVMANIFPTENVSEWRLAIRRYKGQINQNLPNPSPQLQQLLTAVLLAPCLSLFPDYL